MDALRKRHLLAALEGQLERWRRNAHDRQARQRVLVLLKRLQQGPELLGDARFMRRIAARLASLPPMDDALAFSATLTLVRMDCLLWQISLSHGRPVIASAA